MVIVLTSCEKTIDFELQYTDPQLVIEATANGTTQTTEVLLSQSGDYYNSDGFEKISGAEVLLSVENNPPNILSEKDKGIYIGEGTIILPGQICKLEINENGKHYTAISQMPSPIMVDSAYFQYSPETLFAPEGFRAIVSFTDPSGPGNYYRILMEIDGQMVTDGVYYLFSDEAGTQGPVNYLLYKNALTAGSSIRIKLLSIDKTTFDYYSELEALSGSNPGPDQAAPANPENNIQPGALGYFSVRAESISETILIQTK